MNKLNKEGIKFGIEAGCDIWFMFGKTSLMMSGLYVFFNLIYDICIELIDMKQGSSDKHKNFISIIALSFITSMPIGFFKYLFFPVKIIMVFFELIGIVAFLKGHWNGRTMNEEVKTWFKK